MVMVMMITMAGVMAMVGTMMMVVSGRTSTKLAQPMWTPLKYINHDRRSEQAGENDEVVMAMM